MAIIGFTGTRRGMTAKQKTELWKLLHTYDEFHHGDCVGADTEAHDIACEVGVYVVVHPPIATKYRAYRCGHGSDRMPKSYMERNLDIVTDCDYLVAAPQTMTETQRSGTWATVRMARRMGKQVIVLEP